LQAERQEIDVRRVLHYARSRREAPRSPNTGAPLGSLRPLRAGESADPREFPQVARSQNRRGTLRSRYALDALGSG
jgi:hypothetical protein